jgi:cytochrome c oxidase subunit IV
MSAEPHPHRTSLGTYLMVWAALILLTLSTVGAAALPLKAWGLEEWHTPIGLAIAVAKAVLIVLFFMHALQSSRLVWMVITVVVLFLAILYAFTWADFATRGLDNGVRDPSPRHAALSAHNSQ